MKKYLIVAIGVMITSAISSLPAVAQDQEKSEIISEGLKLMKLCRADFQHLCSDVKPGGGRVLACMQAHIDQLSDSCREAMPRMAALKARADKADLSKK